MYKLLTTTAIIIATASSASAWEGAKELIQGLNNVYTGVDGQAHFTGLQSGALGDFVGEANKGVTHVVLKVEADNTIAASIEGGTSLANIQGAQTNLINQVNYDLFVDGDTTTVEAYTEVDAGTPAPGYTPGTDTPTNPGGTPITSVDNDGTVNWANANSGLVGVKVGKVVAAANAINDYLTSETGASTDTTAFTTAFDAKTGVFGTADIGALFGHIEGADGNGGINSSITAAANGAGTFFGNVNDQQGENKVVGSTLSDFSTGGFTLGSDGSLSDGNKNYDTLLDWAIGETPAP